MGQDVLRVERLENGYEVEVCDQKIMEQNEMTDSKKPWKSPWKGYAFDTAAEVAAFIGEHLDKLKPPPDADKEYAGAFTKASKED